MSKRLLECSLSLFLLVCSVSILLTVFYAKTTLEYYLTLVDEQRKTQEQILQTASEVKEVLFEASTALAVRVLEQKNVIPQTDADEMVIESINIIKQYSKRLGEIAKYLNDQAISSGMLPQKKMPTDLDASKLTLMNVNGSFIDSEKAGNLFVIRGKVQNGYHQKRNFILVKGVVLDDKGKVIKEKSAYAGNSIDEAELLRMSLEEIRWTMKNRHGREKKNLNVKPDTSIDFMIVFENLPINLGEFTVEAISSTP